MTEPNLSDLGVHAQNVEAVEDEIFARAEVHAEKAEAEELAANVRKLDEQLHTLHSEEKLLLRSSFTTRANRRLSTVQKNIRNLESKKRQLLDAKEARQEIKEKSHAAEGCIADDKRKEGESERDFLVRTGRVTPFQGQFGYERGQGVPSGATRRKLNVGSEHLPVNEGVHQQSRSTISREECEQTMPSTVSQEEERKSSADSDEYIPSESETDDLFDKEADEKKARRRLKKKKKLSFANAVDYAEESSDEPSGDSPLNFKEGEEWTMEEEEEVEFEGGLRIPCSIYDKLFDYQRTGVRNVFFHSFVWKDRKSVSQGHIF